MGTMKKGILVLDPRTKILLLLGINIYVFTNSYVWAEIIVMAALIILLLLCGVYKAALKSAVTYIALLAPASRPPHLPARPPTSRPLQRKQPNTLTR